MPDFSKTDLKYESMQAPRREQLLEEIEGLLKHPDLNTDPTLEKILKVSQKFLNTGNCMVLIVELDTLERRSALTHVLQDEVLEHILVEPPKPLPEPVGRGNLPR